jgi:hypothetical protein
MTKKLDNEGFIARAILIGDNATKYNYNEITYVDYGTEIKIYCNECREYFYDLFAKNTTSLVLVDELASS